MCKAHRLVYHSTLGLRVIKKKKKKKKTLALSQSIWSHESCEDGTFPAPNLTGLFHTPSMST